MRPPRLNIILIDLFLISSCDVRTSDVSLAAGLPSATPFQPLSTDLSGSPYAGAAPTPMYLPSVAPLSLAPTEVVILPESLPTEVTIPAFTLPTSLNPLTGLPASDPSLLERRPLAIKVANYPRY